MSERQRAEAKNKELGRFLGTPLREVLRQDFGLEQGQPIPTKKLTEILRGPVDFVGLEKPFRGVYTERDPAQEFLDKLAGTKDEFFLPSGTRDLRSIVVVSPRNVGKDALEMAYFELCESSKGYYYKLSQHVKISLAQFALLEIPNTTPPDVVKRILELGHNDGESEYYNLKNLAEDYVFFDSDLLNGWVYKYNENYKQFIDKIIELKHNRVRDPSRWKGPVSVALVCCGVFLLCKSLYDTSINTGRVGEIMQVGEEVSKKVPIREIYVDKSKSNFGLHIYNKKIDNPEDIEEVGIEIKQEGENIKFKIDVEKFPREYKFSKIILVIKNVKNGEIEKIVLEEEDPEGKEVTNRMNLGNSGSLGQLTGSTLIEIEEIKLSK